jgi:hypothetical protein
MTDYIKIKAKITINNYDSPQIEEILTSSFISLFGEKRSNKLFTHDTETGYFNYYKENFKINHNDPPFEKLMKIKSEIENYTLINERNRVLLEILAPEFFKVFQSGEIWFLELNAKELHKIYSNEPMPENEDDDEVRTSYLPNDFKSIKGNFSFAIWLNLMMFSLYPYINGVISNLTENHFIIFFTNHTFNCLDEHSTSRELISSAFRDIYSDNIGVIKGQSGVFPIKYAVFQNNKDYYHWYIKQANSLIGELLKIEDLKKRIILSLTLNRIAIDTLINELTNIPYRKKILLFGVVDKISNLFTQLGCIDKKDEIEIWKKLFSYDFYINNIADVFSSLPRSTAYIFNKNAEWIYEYLDLIKDNTDADVLWELRNSYHSYGLCNLDILLNHSGEINNDLTSLAKIFWLWLLSKGLPEKTIL